jgi:alpha-amylase/alpha-mannosidase (GH57 family)
VAYPLHVAFVWHMHQPFYKDTETGEYTLPWVRLHAVKDYLHLAEVIREFPDVHQTINFVPSLVEQLEDYARGRAIDPALAASQREPLRPEDKQYLLQSFFSINWDRFVWPVPRYAQLARVREAVNGGAELLSDIFWIDLVVWFNLAWVDPSTRRRDPRLRALVEKGQNFDRSDIATVLAYHREACAGVIPAYRQLADRGQVELSTTPFFHPILPLIIDTGATREAHPGVELPRLRFNQREDAREHLERAIAAHRQAFGVTPRGVWPAEGAVSQDLIVLTSEFPSVRWIATDEHILARALNRRFDRDGYGHLVDPRALCQPYRVKGFPTTVFFRDQTLSDRIGFVYQHMDSVEAADDLVGRLLHIWHVLSNDDRPYIVSIILDGENCWEAYPNNGDDFLRRLFDRLSREPRLRAVTPNEFLDQFGASEELTRLPAGSWIASNFDTWIGEPDQNRAWEYLTLARSCLAQWERDNPVHDGDASAKLVEAQRERARQAMLVAEGSDWFWWYYSRNRIGDVNPFDVAFRQHLANVYRAIDQTVPSWLTQPISGHAPERQRSISDLMELATLSGNDQAAVAWSSAGFVEPDASTGTMQHGTTFFRRMYYGYDRTNLYVRWESVGRIDENDLTLYVGAQDLVPSNRISQVDHTWETRGIIVSFAWRILVLGRDGRRGAIARANAAAGWDLAEGQCEVAIGENAAEARIPLATLCLAWGKEIQIAATATRDGQLVEVIPNRGPVSFRLDERPSSRP